MLSLNSNTLSSPVQVELSDELLRQIIAQLSSQAEAILIRDPVMDTHCPLTSDIDVLAFREDAGLLPERLYLSELPDAPMLDVIWLSKNALRDPEQFAQYGLLPHRLLSSKIIYDKEGFISHSRKAVQKKMYQPDIQLKRIMGILQLADETVREIGVTWDFPAMALFWLHMSYTVCLAAVCDGMRILCPNMYTRPFNFMADIEEKYQPVMKRIFIDALHLEARPIKAINLLRSIHKHVSARYPEPEWQENMREDTRYEYRYFLSEEELKWRIQVAEEMVSRVNPYAAVYYLRFWAYALSRIPMVYHRAQEGIDVSFLRPERAMRPDLEKNCPEVLDDLAEILSGQSQVTINDITHSLDMLFTFRDKTLDILISQGIELSEVPEWQPFKPPPQ
ncbi:MAG: hypothetical protein ACYSUH_06080 [Planctomycetota bacterium]|jgi:hypothetical protein